MGMTRMMTRVMQWRTRHSDEAGQGLAEYALILVFVALACVMALQALGGAIASSPGFTTLPSAF